MFPAGLYIYTSLVSLNILCDIAFFLSYNTAMARGVAGGAWFVMEVRAATPS